MLIKIGEDRYVKSEVQAFLWLEEGMANKIEWAGSGEGLYIFLKGREKAIYTPGPIELTLEPFEEQYNSIEEAVFSRENP